MIRLAPFLALILAAGCNGKSPLPPGAGASPPPLPPPLTASAPALPEPREKSDTGKLQFTATADAQTLRRGQTLTVSMQLQNAAKDMQTLDFPSGQDFDLEARQVENGVIGTKVAWTWSAGKMFSMLYRQVAVRPNQPLKFTATWDGTGSGGQVPRGEYEIVAFSASVPRLQAEPFRVTLK